MSKNAGKSKSRENSKGKRRMRNGKELAPKSLRKRGKVFLSECNEEQLNNAEVI